MTSLRLLPLLLAIPLLASAQEAPAKDTHAAADALLAKVRAKLYSPAAAGVKDLVAQITTPAIQEVGGKLMLRWKRSEGGALVSARIEGLSGPTPPMLSHLATQLQQTFGELLVGATPLVDRARAARARLALSEQDGRQRVTITPLGAGDDARVTVEIDPATLEPLLIKGRLGDEVIEMKPRYQEQDGKLLLVGYSLPVAQLGGENELTIGWSEVGGVRLPTALTIKLSLAGDKQPVSFAFKMVDPKTNQGLEDSAFEARR